MRALTSGLCLQAAAAAIGLCLGGCASPSYHDPFDRSAEPQAQTVTGEAPSGPSVKVLLSGSTAASMRSMADFANLGAKMMNPASFIDPMDPRHIQEELNRLLAPRFRSIEYVYWNEPDTGRPADCLLTLEIDITLAKHSFAENIVDLKGTLVGPDPAHRDVLSGHGSGTMGFPATLRSFGKAKEEAFGQFALALEGSTVLASFNRPAAAPATQAVAAATPSPRAAAVEAPPPVAAKPEVRGGVYDVESKITFNVLDSVYFDAATGQLALIGHHDDSFKGEDIPYLQFLATLLECPKPEFTLTWTPDSSRQIDSLFARELTQQESDEQGERLGKLVDPSGNISRVGALMLPALGISPIRDHLAPGDLGVEVGSAGNGQVAIMKLKPGSAADRAGLKLIDFIYSIGGDSPVFFKSEFERRVRFAGAGSRVKITYYRQGQWYTAWATLDAADDSDPWRNVTRYDLIGMLYRAAGNPSAAGVIEAMGVMNSMIAQKEPYAGAQAYEALMDALGMEADFKQFQAASANGSPSYQDSYNFSLKMSQHLDSIFSFPGNPMQARFQSVLQQTNNLGTAVSSIFDAFDQQLVPKIGELIDRLIFRPGVGFQIPPELVEDEYHIHPEMTPEYLGVPRDSQLARLMLAGDYVCKQLTNRQDLRGRIPGYVTQIEFQINHPDSSRPSSSAYRMWTSIDGVDAAQSADGKTLSIRAARMRFNLRQTDSRANDLAGATQDAYGDLLTSLYDPLERQFPEMHEIREAAKLAAVAHWMQRQDPMVRLPSDGRAAWTGPGTVKGLVYIYLTQNLQRESKIIKIAEGGVSLKTDGLFPVDPSVVDLRGNPSFATLFSKPQGASAGAASNPASQYVAGWVAPVSGGAPGQQAVVLQSRQDAATSAFGTHVSNEKLTETDTGPKVEGTDKGANHQLEALAVSTQKMEAHPGSEATASANAQVGFDRGAPESGAVDASGIQAPPSAPEEIQIPASMLNDKDLASDMLKLNFYRQQAKQSHEAASAAQEKFETEKKSDPQSAKLPVLLEQAKEAQDKAGNLDNMVKFTTGEIKKKISFAKISTDGDEGTPAQPAPAAPSAQPSAQPPAQASPQPQKE